MSLLLLTKKLIVNQRAAHYFKKKNERERESTHIDYNESCCLLFTEGEHKQHSDSFNSQQPHCAVSPSKPKNRKKKNIYLAAITVTVPHTGTMCSNYMHTWICKCMHVHLRNSVKSPLDANLLFHKTFFASVKLLDYLQVSKDRVLLNARKQDSHCVCAVV